MSETRKVTISELKEKIEAGVNYLDIFDVKSYLPYFTKANLIKEIADSCISIDDKGIARIDYCLTDYMIENAMVQFYSSIEDIEFKDGDEIDNSIMGNYDFLKENQIIETIISSASEDYYYIVSKVYDLMEQEIKLHNSIEGIIANGLNKLLEKLPDEKGMKAMIASLPKAINKIDLDKLELVKDVVGFNKPQK